MQNKKVFFHDLGLIDYRECWDIQKTYFNATIERKLQNRDLPETEQTPTENHLIFCEHPHVYTLGKSGDETNLLLNDDELKQKHAQFFHINRGGDITYHGPGQLIGYPVFDLDNFTSDIHLFLRLIEQAAIKTLTEYGIYNAVPGGEGHTGVWLDFNTKGKARKILAIGVHTSRWVTMHGFALNVNTDLDYFQNIVPCAIPDKSVTSIQKELGRKIDIEEAKERMKKNLAEVFKFELIEKVPF
ncbi:MAG: Octanoyltransferase [Bacteroidia bacterium]|nr:Octanoyltransferase [Bacteroidia bacterium]